MAPSLIPRIFVGFLVVLWSGKFYANGCYSSIFSFGDSISDTGNRWQLSIKYPEISFDCLPPCGLDGRCCNGRLIVDFLAESFGLPYLPPYVNAGNDTALGGVNYAVSGATVLEASYLEARWDGTHVMNTSLGVQLKWFKRSLRSICGYSISDCKEFVGSSLIVLGSLGSNDYNHMLSSGIGLDEVRPYVPLVVDALISAVNDLIEMGARNIIVPGHLPMGCFAAVLTMYVSEDDAYNPLTGCHVGFNEFTEYHNIMLREKLNQTQQLNPNTNIIYGDYYNAGMKIFYAPDKYGFINGVLKCCNGGGGPFNFNNNVRCGDPLMTMCDEPNTYVSWDGIHFTEAANNIVAKSILTELLHTTPEFYSSCLTSSTMQNEAELSSSI